MEIKLSDGRTELWQYEINRQLTIIEDSITVDYLHIESDLTRRAMVVPVYTDSNSQRVCRIPDILLTDEVSRLICYPVDASDGIEVLFQVEFKVNERQKPNDYTSEETQVLSFTNVLTEMKDIQSHIVSQKDSVDKNAQSVEANKTIVQSCADQSYIYQTNAQASALSASTSASAAALSASSASTSKTETAEIKAAAETSIASLKSEALAAINTKKAESATELNAHTVDLKSQLSIYTDQIENEFQGRWTDKSIAPPLNLIDECKIQVTPTLAML